MHIMGGFGVASLSAAVFAYFKKPVTLWNLFLIYVAVASVWELYEYINDLAQYTDWNGWFDTIKDYLNGLIGVGLAYLFIGKK